MIWRLPPRVPESWPTPRRAEGLVSDPVEYPEPLPVWVAPAWDLLGSDPHLSMGLTMWHQCLLLTAEFPSFALVALGGCIEELSHSVAFNDQLGEMPPAWPQCGNVPGATKRFWELVGLVASPEELSQLRAQRGVYGKRSKTAHGSALHGFEPYFGSLFYFDYVPPTATSGPLATIDQNDPAQVFTLETLPMVGNIAARLLARGLNAPPP